MGVVAKRQPVTSPDARSKRAFEIEQKVVAGCQAIRTVWVALAEYLHEFYGEQMWEARDCETFEDWLGSPEISLSRSHVYALVQCYEELVVKRGVEQERLEAVEVSKVQQVLPALRREEVDLETALADCEALSRASLREKYGRSLPASRKPLVQCEKCGLMRQPADPESATE